MKKIVATIAALTLCLLLLLFVRQCSTGTCWYGYCKIGDDYPKVALISVGDEVYYDQNSDQVPQSHELIPGSGTITVRAIDGVSTVNLRGISAALVSNAVSDDCPQLIDLKIQSNEFPELHQYGTIVTARDPDSAGTCHLLGPLSFIFQSSDVELQPGEPTELKISIGTTQSDSNAISPFVGPSTALVCTSVPNDRTKYAFEDALRPTMEISFNNQSAETETVVFDGFC